jgi:hypothetical protein
MIDGFTDAQVIGALFALIGGLILIVLTMVGAFFGWVVRSIHQLDRKIDSLDSKLSARMDRIDGRVEALTIAVSRLEGAVYHGLPEPRRAVSEQ